MADDPDLYAENYEFQVPIFVVGDRVPPKHPKETGELMFTFVADGIESAIKQAKAAAGGKDVLIIGSASTTLQCLKTGLVDDLYLDIVPIFLNEGFRPFEDIKDVSIQLERTKVVELPAGRIFTEFRLNT